VLSTPPRQRGATLGRSVVWILLLAVSMALAVLLYFGPHPTDRRPAPPPDVSDPEETIAAFTGELAAADGGWLIATLAPLHFDSRRQAFERDTLERRLGLADGEPWRLSLRWEAARPDAPRGDAAGSAAARLGLHGLSIEDEHGKALEPLPDVAANGSDPVLPLRTLLSPPAGSLGPGETLDWILWGRAPGLGASLIGLAEDANPSANPFHGPLELRATRLRRADLGQPLARLDRDQAGKNPPAQTSGTRDGVESR
jgi:hypothetical protein